MVLRAIRSLAALRPAWRLLTRAVEVVLRLLPAVARARLRRLHRGYTYSCDSVKHSQWLAPLLEACGFRRVPPTHNKPTFRWSLHKRALPDSRGACVFNCLPQMTLLDDKAVLALLCRRGFRRTRPLTTHLIYGEWDHARLAALQRRWADSQCCDPRLWIIKDAHSSNGFSAALFDRKARTLAPEDVPGGYCYVLQEYIDRPLLLDGRKFELRQYVLLCGDGAGYTYRTALIRLASVRYCRESTDRRAHITNKFVQTQWEARSDLVNSLDEIEWTTCRWPAYTQHLFDSSIVPLIADLLDSISPLLASRRKYSPASVAAGRNFELFACDLVVTSQMQAHLMEVNINPAFGTFSETTVRELIRPMFSDLVSLTAAEAMGEPVREGGFCCIRRAEAVVPGSGAQASPAVTMPPGAAADADTGQCGAVAQDEESGCIAGGDAAGGGRGATHNLTGTCRATVNSSGLSLGREGGAGVDELSAHMAYMAFKSSHRKRYEKKQGAESAKPLWRTPPAVEDFAAAV